MQKPEIRELVAFAEVARQLNFTRAAAALSISVPSLSQAVRGLEDKLGVGLLTRTTRSVSLTDAGEHLLAQVRPILQDLDSAFDELTRFRKTPRGRLCILVSRAAAAILIAPIVGAFLAEFPDIDLELKVDDLHLDLVAHRIDAGIQIAERIEKDMIITRVMGPIDLFLMASPGYLEQHPPPSDLEALHSYSCVCLRSPWDDAVHAWALENGSSKIELQVGARFVVNDLRILAAVVAGGAGIGLIPAVVARPWLESGALVRVLPEWRSTVSGIFIYYPSRKHVPATLRTFIEFVREHRPIFDPNGRAPTIAQTSRSQSAEYL